MISPSACLPRSATDQLDPLLSTRPAVSYTTGWDVIGIGALNATALVAAVGSAATFGKGRDLAAWLGLVPRQATTGGKPRLLGITKRGSRYLRKMLIQGARSAMPSLTRSDTAAGAWLRALLRRAHPNVAVVALAAKMARTVWALLRHGGTYDPAPSAAG